MNKPPGVRYGNQLVHGSTPNGRTISIALEEMALPYEIQVIDFARKEQKSDWYLKLNPNGRIPTLLDDDFPARGTREARPSARP